MNALLLSPNCAKCGGQVEPERFCYLVATCYRCLPPPEPLPIVPWPAQAVATRGRKVRR